jgi:PAS domain S-box-containing protein
MDKGGPHDINQRTSSVLRTTALFVPAMLVCYGVLIQLGIVPQTHYLGNAAFWTLSAVWMIVAGYQYLVPPKNHHASLIRLIAYHALAAIYVLIVSGFSTPLIVLWTVLLLASYIYAGRDGVYMSVFILFATGIADILVGIDSPMAIAINALYSLATLIVGYVAVAVILSQEVRRSELERSHAEEQLQRDRLTTIINNLTDGVLSTDSDGVIQMYNAASLNLLDTNSGLVGQHIDEVVHLYDAENHGFKLTKEFKKARSVTTRDDLRATISDETIRIGLVYSPIRSTDSSGDAGSKDGYIIMLRDITKQKSLEEERDEFISVVSHELRTPITIAEGTISNVQVMMGRPDIGTATLSQSIDLAHEQVIFLAKMVNDLSTLSRAERGVADTAEDIDVDAMIQELYTEYAPQAQTKGLSFDLDLSPKLGIISASPLYLKELLQNFVTNAIKYTKEGGITVIVKAASGKLSFNVRDTGIGLSKSDQAHIYEKFWRSEDYRTRETGGTGLGLYVATKLAKKLGTKIEMTSRLNHGSTFGFSLNITKH